MIHASAPNLEVLYLDHTTLDIIPDADAVVSRDCTRLIIGNGSDIDRNSANRLARLLPHLKGNWDEPMFQATVKKWIV